MNIARCWSRVESGWNEAAHRASASCVGRSSSSSTSFLAFATLVAAVSCSYDLASSLSDDSIRIGGPASADAEDPIEFSVINSDANAVFVSCALEISSTAGWQEVWKSLHSDEPTKSVLVTEIFAGETVTFLVDYAPRSTLVQVLRRLGAGPYRVRVDVRDRPDSPPVATAISREFEVRWQ